MDSSSDTVAGMQEFHRLLEKLWSNPEPHYFCSKAARTKGAKKS